MTNRAGPETPEGVVGRGELRTTRQPETAVIRMREQAHQRCVRVSRIDGVSIFEGDIVLGRAVEALGAVVAGPGGRWPGRTVVYAIHKDLPEPERVREAIAHWEAKTVIRFKQKTSEGAYLLFRPGGGCSSSVGFQQETQLVTLGPYCTMGNVIHEIGHSIGLWHEQSREDRDQHVTIDWSNVDPLTSHNFDQHINDGDDVGRYDYGSIMHYPKDAFALDATKPTIVTKHGETIGQRIALSAGDIDAVAKLYAGVAPA